MLGLTLKEFREKAGLNQADVAAKVGVSNVTISRYERDERHISFETLTKLAGALGVSVEEIQAEVRAKEEDFERIVENHRKSKEASTQPTHVHSQESLVTWIRAVGRAQHPDPMIKLLLLTLPILIDEDAWIVLATTDQLIEVTHMQEAADKIRDVWPQVVGSPWVERVGQVEWVFRLRFAETQKPSPE